jgi:hypothetical protein
VPPGRLGGGHIHHIMGYAAEATLRLAVAISPSLVLFELGWILAADLTTEPDAEMRIVTVQVLRTQYFFWIYGVLRTSAKTIEFRPSVIRTPYMHQLNSQPTTDCATLSSNGQTGKFIQNSPLATDRRNCSDGSLPQQNSHIRRVRRATRLPLGV